MGHRVGAFKDNPRIVEQRELFSLWGYTFMFLPSNNGMILPWLIKIMSHAFYFFELLFECVCSKVSWITETGRDSKVHPTHSISQQGVIYKWTLRWQRLEYNHGTVVSPPVLCKGLQPLTAVSLPLISAASLQTVSCLLFLLFYHILFNLVTEELVQVTKDNLKRMCFTAVSLIGV